MQKKMTAASIGKLNQPGDYGDQDTIGLWLRITPARSKIFRYQYNLRGKRRFITLGRFPDVSLAEARAQATANRAQVLEGIDPAANAQKARAAAREMPTVEEFVETYIERYAKPKTNKKGKVIQRGKKTWRQDLQMLERWVVPEIGRLKMNEVERRDIVKILDDCRDAGNVRQPGKILAVTRMLFKVAVQRGVLDSSPCSYIEESQPEPAQKAMTDEHIRQWWDYTGEVMESDSPEIPKPIALALRLMLLTGQRPGEVAGMTRDELHLDSALGPHWIIPAERRLKGRKGKGAAHAVALGTEAIKTIETALSYSIDEYVFMKPSGGPYEVSALSQALRTKVFENIEDHPTPHAARHTVATELEELDVAESHVGRVLGHASKSVTGQVYINNRLNERSLSNQRRHVELWQSRLNEILSGDAAASNVISMGERA